MNELGSLPDGWILSTLGGVVEIFNGKASGTGGSWLRVFKTRHVYDGFVSLHDPAYVPDDRARAVPRTTHLKTGDTLTPNMAHGTIGRVAYVKQAEENWTIDGQITVLRARDPERLLPRFLFDWMSTPAVKRALIDREKGGVFGELRGQTHLYRRDIETIEIVLPTPAEQRRIAAVLSAIDDSIERTQAVIEQLQVVKKAIMQELLTRGLPGRHARFKRTAIGDVPEIWDVVTIDSLGRAGEQVIRTGPFGSSMKTKDFREAGTPVLTIQSLGQGEILREGLFYVDEFKAAELTEYAVKSGDIVFSRVADIGRSVAMEQENAGWLISPNLMRIRLDRAKSDSRFLMYMLTMADPVRKQVEMMAGNAGRQVVSSGVLKQLLLPMPPVDEQREIAAVARTVEVRLHAEMSVRDSLQVLKSGLMSGLLTGEVRVTPDPEPSP